MLLGMQISYIGNKKFLNLGKANAGASMEQECGMLSKLKDNKNT